MNGSVKRNFDKHRYNYVVLPYIASNGARWIYVECIARKKASNITIDMSGTDVTSDFTLAVYDEGELYAYTWKTVYDNKPLRVTFNL